MSKFRVYLEPKGYEDYECCYVELKKIMGGWQAIIVGGEHDGKHIDYVRGARML